MTLTILNDAAGVTGGTVHELDPALTLQANIERHLASGADAALHINGQRVDPLTDPRMDMPPASGDRVCIVCRPAGLETITWLYIASIALSVYSYASLKKPQSPTTPKESPNNRLTGQTNVARSYQAIPDVYGFRRVWPDLIQPSSVEYIGNVKYVTEWLCVSRGKGTITNIQYADTPLAEITGATYSIFEPAATPSAYPELNSTTLTNIVEAFESPEINGQELPYALGASDLVIRRDGTTVASSGASSWTFTTPDTSEIDPIKTLVGSQLRVWNGDLLMEGALCNVVSFSTSAGNVTFNFSFVSYVFAGALSETREFYFDIAGYVPTTTTVGPFTLPVDGDGIRYNIVFLRGLKGTVNITAEWWKINSSGVEISGTRQTQAETFIGDTFDEKFYTRNVTPSGGLGRYRIQFTRTNPANATGSDVAKLEAVYALRRYPTKVLPGVTVVRVTTRATQQAIGVSERKFNLRWQRHVRTLTGTTLSASRNFARAMAHIWSIAGEDIAGLDTTALAAINTPLGETSPLLRFDGSLDDADLSMGERLALVANHARCTLWRDGQKWTVTRDQARTTPELQLDYRNLAAGADSVINYSAHLPASNDGVELEYVDETTQAKKAYVRLVITSGAPVVGTPQRPLKLSLAGCTTAAQATNRARLEARKLLFQRTSVTDSCLGDGQSLGPGSLVRWIDPNDFAGDDKLQAGEVMTIAGSTITTSELLDFKSLSSGRIVFTGVDGAPLGSPVVCTPGAGGAVTLASVPAGLYVANDGTRQLGSRYAFAVGLTDAETQAAGLYTVVDIKPTGEGIFQLSLVNYDARVYADD